MVVVYFYSSKQTPYHISRSLAKITKELKGFLHSLGVVTSKRALG